jgi:hypothetical protein
MVWQAIQTVPKLRIMATGLHKGAKLCHRHWITRHIVEWQNDGVLRHFSRECIFIAFLTPHLKRSGGDFHKPQPRLIRKKSGIFPETRVIETRQSIASGSTLHRTETASTAYRNSCAKLAQGLSQPPG